MNPNKLHCYKWTPTQQKLIQLVKDYKVCEIECEILNYNKKILKKMTWDRISRDLEFPAIKCRSLWYNIQLIYKRLKLLVLEGKITESEVRNNDKVANYFDGSLDFLDPYIKNASPYEIKKIQQNERAKLTISHLLGIDIDMDTKYEASVNRGQEVYEAATSTDGLPKEECSKRPDLAIFLVKHSFSNEKHTLKTYMDDLSRAVCTTLQPADRRLFIKEIDTIVSDLLQG
ncbi:hypothetical protein SFRURICE_016715 [Spodoptera frugiperda]|nr:hypothetical protein SFRURICE_016715 [Spodoptera frugiperda]